MLKRGFVDYIYIEEEIASHPRTLAFCKKIPHATTISIKRYTEVFNPKAQNFRIQKARPSLIIAKKHQNPLLPIPKSYGIGSPLNFYFSHLLNCPYDCSYCFLQGMYHSAHFVLFINYEDFQEAIIQKIQEHEGEQITFFSGYDSDSLALDPLTHFTREFIPFFANYPRAYLELRTKSAQIHFAHFLNPIPNCIIAFSLNPEPIASQLEHKAPPLHLRLRAIQRLQEKGWHIGLRFDPVIYCENYQDHYRKLFCEVFQLIDMQRLHSVSLGAFRLPKNIYQNMLSLMPTDPLLNVCMPDAKIVTFEESLQKEILLFCKNQLLNYISESKLFLCTTNETSL